MLARNMQHPIIIMIYKSYAKLNIFLDVVTRYKNTYHGIKSIFCQISLCDVIDYRPNDLKVVRVFDSKGVLPEDNLLTKAADSFSRFTGRIPRGIDFHIEKNIPMGGGLGGGSSNAAAVLNILNKYWNAGCSNRNGRGWTVVTRSLRCVVILDCICDTIIKPLSKCTVAAHDPLQFRELIDHAGNEIGF